MSRELIEPQNRERQLVERIRGIQERLASELP